MKASVKVLKVTFTPPGGEPIELTGFDSGVQAFYVPRNDESPFLRMSRWYS
jgi:hypothetical protein